ncbi:MAG: creatininase family protein [Acidobacteriota bacterium]
MLTSTPMPPQWSEQTWRDLAALDRSRTVALLPIGAVEAHGPHLPLNTDGLIAEGMVREAAQRLSEGGRWRPLVLPTLDYTPAGFAANFPGTISIRPHVLTELITDIARSLADQGVGMIAIASAHFDPANLEAILRAVREIEREGRIAIAFPNLTRKPWASRLTDEFKSGACHAGQYEGSVVLAERPDLVREDRRRTLPANPKSLSTAIRDGLASFEEAGGPEAYFGDPAAATAAEGIETLRTLGAILEEAVMEASEKKMETAP